ncbi:GNAT family N-acetyltransferase [Leptolyngbya sp. AN02str]|uniref:GNAT family N-acetyltransferase n=1 Tax=Leptolyngbya sp. AN02str TaxID=3423363 RepID=UPI003D3103F2
MHTHSFHIRPFHPEDTEHVGHIYVEAIYALAEHYTPDQCAAWAASADDRAAFGDRLLRGLTVVLETDGKIAAFGQLHPSNHIDLMFCATEFARRGFASRVLEYLEAEARSHDHTMIHTEASLAARPFFERHGFQVVESEVVSRKGVDLRRFIMMKPLTQPS